MSRKLIHLIILFVLIIQLSQSAVLDCDFSSGYCSVVSITDVTSPNERISIAGKPAAMTFGPPSILHYVPTSLFSIFPNIQSFTMRNVSLNHLVTDAFMDAGNMDSLTITENNFPDIPASFCSSCGNLRSLELPSNNIQKLDSNALKGIKLLNILNLHDNKITCIPPRLLQNTPEIQSIDLSANQITSFDRETFKGLSNLHMITLSYNKIVSIPDFDFTLTGILTGLALMIDNNPIMAIHPQFLTHLFSSSSNLLSHNIYYHDLYLNSTTCISQNNMNMMNVASWSWKSANNSLGECYANWTPEIEFTPVSCAN